MAFFQINSDTRDKVILKFDTILSIEGRTKTKLFSSYLLVGQKPLAPSCIMKNIKSNILYWIGQTIGLSIVVLGIIALSTNLLSASGIILVGGIIYVLSSDPSGRVSLLSRLIHAIKATGAVFKSLPWIKLLFEWHSKYNQDVNQESEAMRIIDDFEEIACDNLEVPVDQTQFELQRGDIIERVTSEAEIFKRDAYPIIAEYAFNDFSEDDRRLLLILVLCYEHQQADERHLETGEAVYALKSAITRELADLGCDFEEPNTPATRLLTAYGHASPAIHSGKAIDGDLFDEQIDRSYFEVWKEFRRSFLPFEEQVALDDQLLSTIIDVIDRGELDQSAVAGDVDELIQEERERVKKDLQNREAYLVLSSGSIFSKTSGLRTKLESKYHNHISFGARHNTSDVADIPDPTYVTFHIIFPEKEFISTDAFLDDVLRLIPEEELEENAFVTVYKLEATNPQFEPSKETLEEELPAYLKSNLDVVEFLETGSGSRTVTKTAINNLLGRKVRVRDILAAVPFNVFAEATPRQEQFLNSKYGDLKDEFQIKELYDWCNYTKEDIAPVLIKWDDSELATEEEWKEIARQMIRGARQCESVADL